MTFLSSRHQILLTTKTARWQPPSNLMIVNTLLEEELVLIEAARRNDADLLYRLLQIGKINVDARNSLDRTALHWAAANGQIMAVDLLLRAGADPNIADKIGMAPVLWASWFGHSEVIRLLHRSRKANLTIVNRQGMGLLHCAAVNNSVDVLDYVITSLHDVIKPNLSSKDDRTPLHIASERGHVEAVDQLLVFEVDPNIKDKRGLTALHLAAQGGYEETCDILINAGAQVNTADLDGRTPLHLACEEGHVGVARILLNSDAEINRQTVKLMTPLMLASLRGHSEIVEEILGWDHRCTDMQNSNRNTAIHFAAIGGHISVARLLVDSQCNNKLRNESGQTALHLAVENENPLMVQLLLAAGWNSAIKDKKGRDALRCAVRAGFSGIVDLIIKSQRSQQLMPSNPEQIQCQDEPAAEIEEYYDEVDGAASGEVEMHRLIDRPTGRPHSSNSLQSGKTLRDSHKVQGNMEAGDEANKITVSLSANEENITGEIACGVSATPINELCSAEALDSSGLDIVISRLSKGNSSLGKDSTRLDMDKYSLDRDSSNQDKEDSDLNKHNGSLSKDNYSLERASSSKRQDTMIASTVAGSKGSENEDINFDILRYVNTEILSDESGKVDVSINTGARLNAEADVALTDESYSDTNKGLASASSSQDDMDIMIKYECINDVTGDIWSPNEVMEHHPNVADDSHSQLSHISHTVVPDLKQFTNESLDDIKQRNVINPTSDSESVKSTSKKQKKLTIGSIANIFRFKIRNQTKEQKNSKPKPPAASLHSTGILTSNRNESLIMSSLGSLSSIRNPPANVTFDTFSSRSTNSQNLHGDSEDVYCIVDDDSINSNGKALATASPNKSTLKQNELDASDNDKKVGSTSSIGVSESSNIYQNVNIENTADDILKHRNITSSDTKFSKTSSQSTLNECTEVLPDSPKSTSSNARAASISRSEHRSSHSTLNEFGWVQTEGSKRDGSNCTLPSVRASKNRSQLDPKAPPRSRTSNSNANTNKTEPGGQTASRRDLNSQSLSSNARATNKSKSEHGREAARSYLSSESLLIAYSNPQRYPSVDPDLADQADLTVHPMDRGYRYVYTDEYSAPPTPRNPADQYPRNLYQADLTVNPADRGYRYVYTNEYSAPSTQRNSTDQVISETGMVVASCSDISTAQFFLVAENSELVEGEQLADVESDVNSVFYSEGENKSQASNAETDLNEAQDGTEYSEVYSEITEEEYYSICSRGVSEPESVVPVDYMNLMSDILWKLATKQLKPEEWRKLARYWNFTNTQINAIAYQFTGDHSYRDHGYRMLLIWLYCLTTTQPDLHPMAELYTALAAIGKRKQAEKIRQACNKNYEQRNFCRIS